ncbi:MAG: hypothetical protein ABUL72_03935 [Armatimonadota bacterium]
MLKTILIPVLVVCFGLLLAGCAQEAKMSSQEKSDFRGGPMPPEAAAKMAKAMQESAAKAAANKAGQAAPPAPAVK